MVNELLSMLYRKYCVVNMLRTRRYIVQRIQKVVKALVTAQSCNIPYFFYMIVKMLRLVSKLIIMMMIIIIIYNNYDNDNN